MSRSLRRGVLAVLLGSALVTSLTAVPATADGPAPPGPCKTRSYTPKPGATFGNPEGKYAQQYAVLGPVMNSICSAPRGATVRVATYNINIQRFTDVLKDAHRRKVNVQVLMDGHAAADQWKDLKANLDKKYGPGDTSYALTCSGSCLKAYPGSSIHAKYYMMSAAGKTKHVLTVSSANPTLAQVYRASNNGFTTTRDVDLYNSYRQYFNDMTAAALDPRKRNPDYYRTTSTPGQKTYFYPRSGPGSEIDTVYNALGYVKCTRSSGATVRIAMFQWTKGRKRVADRLVSMGRKGCKIDIIVTAGAVDEEIRVALAGKKNVKLADSSKDENGDGIADHYIHDKYMLISGTYAGKKSRIVFGGSPNFTVNAVHHNEENLVRLKMDSAYDAYRKNFDVLKSRIPVPKQTLGVAEAAAPPLTIPPAELAE